MKSQFAAIGFAVLLALFGNWSSSEDEPAAPRPGQHERRDGGPAPTSVPEAVGRTEYDVSAADGEATASLSDRGLGGGIFDGTGPQLVGVLLPAAFTTPAWTDEPDVTLPATPVWEVPVEPVPVEPVPVEPVVIEPVVIEPVPAVDPVAGAPAEDAVDDLAPVPDTAPVPEPLPVPLPVPEVIDTPVEEPSGEPVAGEPVAGEPLLEDPVLEAPAAPAVPEAPAEVTPADGVPAGLGVVVVGALWCSGGRRRPLRRTACARLSPPSP